MSELLDVVADAVRRAGYPAWSAVGRFPETDSNTVYVVVPHEYFVVTPENDLPSAELRARTVGFCVEHPGTTTFERTAAILPSLGGAVDINRDSTAELRSRGHPVERFQLGYSPLWDHWGGNPDSERDIDVTYLGTAERRRSLLLSSYWRDLDELRVRLLTPPHEPMSVARHDFLPGAAKHDHLARSRFLLNLHRGSSRALEWVRVLEAMCNGCVVITEPSADVAPLTPGVELVVGRAGTLGSVAAALAADPAREQSLRTSAYRFVRERLDLLASARILVELAGSVLSGPPDLAAPPSFGQQRPDVSVRPLAVDTPSWDARFGGSRSLHHPRPTGTFAQANQLVRRTVAARDTVARCWVEPASQDVFGHHARADVDVLLVQRPDEPDPRPLVGDLLGGTTLPRTILVAEDGVGAIEAACPYTRLVHSVPLGRGYSRNSLLARSIASALLVLASDMRASPHLLERLTSVTADVAHCPVGDPVEGIVGALPPESRRLADIPYLGSGYLVTRELLDDLGGWPEDPWFDGLEDHVFWQRVAAGEHASTLVQQVLLYRHRPDPLPRPLDLAPHHVWAKVAPVSEADHTHGSQR